MWNLTNWSRSSTVSSTRGDVKREPAAQPEAREQREPERDRRAVPCCAWYARNVKVWRQTREARR